jgi:hypothetical protein
MQRILASLAALALVAGATLPAAPVLAQQRGAERGDQESARAEMRAGRNMPIGEIERRIVRRMGNAEYLGFEYDRSAGAYRLKFIENGQVIWVDVDARTADILRISR